MESTSNVRKDSIAFLLEAGADITLKNTDGECAFSMADFNADIVSMFSLASKKRCKVMRKEARQMAGGSLKRCGRCSDSRSHYRCRFLRHLRSDLSRSLLILKNEVGAA